MENDPYIGKTVFCEVDSEDVVGEVTGSTIDPDDGHTYYTIKVDYDRSPSSREKIDIHGAHQPDGVIGVNDFEVKMILDTSIGAGRAFGFTSEREARAFGGGVEFVNDSSVKVLGIVKEGDSFWTIRIQDDDRHPGELPTVCEHCGKPPQPDAGGNHHLGACLDCYDDTGEDHFFCSDHLTDRPGGGYSCPRHAKVVE
jgi:hypothetical protein